VSEIVAVTLALSRATLTRQLAAFLGRSAAFRGAERPAVTHDPPRASTGGHSWIGREAGGPSRM